MGEGIHHRILPGLHGHLCQGRGRSAGVFHVTFAPQRVPSHHVVAADVPLGAVLGGHRHRPAGNLLRAERQGHVVDAGGDAPISLPERRRPAGAGVFHIDDWHAGQTQLGQGGLAHGHSLVINVAEVGDGDVLPLDSRVFQGGKHGLDGQRAKVLLWEAAEGMQADSNHHDFTAGFDLVH